MRNPALTIVLVLLALVPIVAWGLGVWATVLSYKYPASTWPSAGGDFGTIVLMLTPAFVGGILMIAGAALLARKPLGARITATVGIVPVLLTVIVFFAFDGVAAGLEFLATAAVYVLLHAGAMVWLWRGWRRSAV